MNKLEKLREEVQKEEQKFQDVKEEKVLNRKLFVMKHRKFFWFFTSTYEAMVKVCRSLIKMLQSMGKNLEANSKKNYNIKQTRTTHRKIQPQTGLLEEMNNIDRELMEVVS